MTPHAETLSAEDLHDLAGALRTAVWSLRRYGERQAGLEQLPHSEFEVIRTVSDNPGISVSDVARTLGLQPSNVSTTVRKLVERGLVRRAADERDRRTIRLYLTAEATEHKGMIDAVWVDGVRRQVAEMSAAEAQVLVQAAPLIRRLARM